MEIKSLGLKTELFFYQYSSVITQHNDFIKIETPNNPDYFWGNLLIFSRPPRRCDFLNWTKLFKENFLNNTLINHLTFTWDIFGEVAETSEFIKNGFVFEETIVLVASQIKSNSYNPNFEYRKIISKADWQQVIELQISIGIETENYNIDKYRPFIENRFKAYEELTTQGVGSWFGAFEDGILVADLGLFGSKEFARFQSIETKKNYRKIGIAQSLMIFAATENKNRPLVIQAVSNGPAIDMYMRIGFEIKEVISGLCLYDQQKWINPKP